MPRLHEKLALQPPSGRIFKERPEFHFVRFQDAKYATTEADLWKEFADAEWKWTNPGRYAGSGLNCGYYYSCSSEAAVSEMDFYNKGAEWQGKKARMTIRSLYNGVFNLTEPDSVAFVFDRLLEFPYRRRSFRLALLASLTVGGNLFTDYIGCWAYHKGFAGVMFLSARALAPHRTDFDPSSLQGSNWGQYWSAMADEFDYYVM